MGLGPDEGFQVVGDRLVVYLEGGPGMWHEECERAWAAVVVLEECSLGVSIDIELGR